MSFSCPKSNISPIVDNRIRVVKGFIPNSTPIIFGLSTYSSQINEHTVVNIVGENFFPFGSSTIKFGVYKNIPVSYFSSKLISFELPLSNRGTLDRGQYDVQVVTIDNKRPTSPLPLYSNKMEYTLF